MNRLQRKTPLRKRSKSETAQTKDRIQALLRDVVIDRDGGCILRHYSEAGACGGYTKAGQLILQAEHLLTRSNSATYADLRNVVCICKRHHIFFKPQHSKLYWQLIERHLGKKNWQWLKFAEADRTPHKVDWKLAEIALEQELKKLL